jgi:hypothetical protein
MTMVHIAAGTRDGARRPGETPSFTPHAATGDSGHAHG